MVIILALYAANLPCSHAKFQTMNDLSESAINFLFEAATGKAWAQSFDIQL